MNDERMPRKQYVAPKLGVRALDIGVYGEYGEDDHSHGPRDGWASEGGWGHGPGNPGGRR